MNPWYLPIGMAIGLIVSAPFGPVNILCLNRGLAFGALSAFAAGIGAAVGDTLYAALAAFGVASFTEVIDAGRDPIRLVGGFIMLGFAFVVWRSEPASRTDKPVLPGIRQAAATFVMTVTNPGVLMGFAAIFAGAGFKNLGMATPDALGNSVVLVLGVFSGALLWWAILALAAAKMKQRVARATLRRINQASAIVLALFGMAALVAGALD